MRTLDYLSFQKQNVGVSWNNIRFFLSNLPQNHKEVFLTSGNLMKEFLGFIKQNILYKNNSNFNTLNLMTPPELNLSSSFVSGQIQL